MLTRRSFLSGSSALVLSQFLLGCNANRSAVKIRLLEDSVPPQLLKLFQQNIAKDAPLNFLLSEQLADGFELLKTWKQQQNNPQPPSQLPFALPFGSPRVAPLDDLITLGDYWLTPAIQQSLIQPLALQEIPEWQQLPPGWQQLVRRDRQGQPSEQGDLWAAPYRWGTLMMVYRKAEIQRLGWKPTDWQDLWRPELKGNLSLPDSARSVIGLTLKKLGQSVNLADLQTLPTLQTELQTLHQQAKFYSSTAYLQPLVLGDTWLAVGWSNEILPLLKRNRQLDAVVPQSGTILTADLWVRPSSVPAEPITSGDRLTLLKQWIGFCWQPQMAIQLSLLTLAASPIFTNQQNNQLPESLQKTPLLIPSVEIQQRSEFLLPLADSSLAQYRQLWTTVRQMG